MDRTTVQPMTLDEAKVLVGHLLEAAGGDAEIVIGALLHVERAGQDQDWYTDAHSERNALYRDALADVTGKAEYLFRV